MQKVLPKWEVIATETSTHDRVERLKLNKLGWLVKSGKDLKFISDPDHIWDLQQSKHLDQVDTETVVDRTVVEFAFRLATVLQENKSSTALFFVQQAYPDEIDAPSEQLSSDQILQNVITRAALALNNDN